MRSLLSAESLNAESLNPSICHQLPTVGYRSPRVAERQRVRETCGSTGLER